MNPVELQEYAEATNKKTVEVLEAFPGIHPVTAMVMAGDLVQAEKVTKQVAAGLITAEKGVWYVGSFARWGWTLAMVAEGRISEDWLADNICDLWSASDPDDTDPANLAVFQGAFNRKGGLLRDGRTLPKGAGGYLTVYRGGQPDSVRNGFAWTTDPKVAQKFANGAGQRVHTPGGVVISGKVRRTLPLAYITGHSEAEVIVDPRLVEVAR
jgi:hypothetical protein